MVDEPASAWRRIRKIGLSIGAVVLAGFLLWPLHANPPAPRDRTVIHLWHPWGGDFGDNIVEVIREFNRTHDDIYVELLYVPTTASNSPKLFIATAGGVPPDVAFVDGTQVAGWADMGVLQPLDKYLDKAGILPGDFWGPSWEQCAYRGHVYALTFTADPNFALVWNKERFAEVGLDPERPPKTIEELEEYQARLTVVDPKTKAILKMGIIPQRMPMPSIAVYTWGWVFGGRFFDPATNQFTPDDPKVVASLEWMVHMANEYGKGLQSVDAFAATFGDQAQNPFYIGQLAMEAMHVITVQEIPKYAPDLRYGIAPLPAPEGGEYGAAWLGGWTIALPRGGRGNDDKAFELIRWLCADPEGTRFAARRMRLFPGYARSPFYDEIGDDPVLSAYLRILKGAKHQRPVSPVQAYFQVELDRAYGAAMLGRKTPLEALQDARRRTAEHARQIERWSADVD